jgi:hypothetical protein
VYEKACELAQSATDAAQAANYSNTHFGHAGTYNVGENAAWNYGTNPYLQWYYQEKGSYDHSRVEPIDDPGYLLKGLEDLCKKNYEKGASTVMSPFHYYAILENYAFTGFAVCSRKSDDSVLSGSQTEERYGRSGGRPGAESKRRLPERSRKYTENL